MEVTLEEAGDGVEMPAGVVEVQEGGGKGGGSGGEGGGGGEGDEEGRDRIMNLTDERDGFF